MNLITILAVVLSVWASVVSGVNFIIVNKCPFPVWPGIQGRNPSDPRWKVPNGGGWMQNPGQTVTITVPDNFASGRIWARTGCRGSGNSFTCDTGNCGS